MRAIVSLLCVSLSLLAGCSKSRSEPSGPLTPASKLYATDVLPHCDGPIVAGRNYVYCASFQLAWDKLRAELGDKAVDLEGRPEMADRLNEHHSDDFGLSPDSYLAMAGRTDEGIVAKIRAELASRFPNATLDVPEPPKRTVSYLYSYLSKNLPFEEEFEPAGPMSFVSPAGQMLNVAAFKATFSPDKAKDRAWRKQVTILDYRDYGDFIVRLNTTSKDDELILASVKPGKTMAATLKAVEERIRSASASKSDETGEPREADHFEAPIISLDVERNYSEVEDKTIENTPTPELAIAEARQGIRFHLDQRGARLESRSHMVEHTTDAIGRMFIFNGPFLLYLKQKDAPAPYLAIWIANSELLQKPQ